MEKVKYQQLYSNILLDIALSFYCHGCYECGMDEKEAVKLFTEKFVMPQIDDPDEILSIYIQLKKMLKYTPDK